MKKFLFFLFSLIISTKSFAADPDYFFTPEAATKPISQISQAAVSIGYIIQLAFSLAVILGFLYLASKYLLPKLKLATKSNNIEVYDKLIVEPQVTLYLIKSCGKSWLIAISNKQVTVIDKIELEEFIKQ